VPGFLVHFFLGEENAIAFAANRSEDGCRSVLRIGDEFEIFRAARPSNGRGVHNEMGIERVLHIMEMDSLLHSTPMHVEGNICCYRGAMHQGVHNCAKVSDLHVAEFHGCGCVIEVDLYTFIGCAYCPKQAAGGDTGVEVVDLIWRNNLSLIEIQSDKAESASMPFPIHPNVRPLHETHIDVEEERGSGAGAHISGCSCSLDFSTSN